MKATSSKARILVFSAVCATVSSASVFVSGCGGESYQTVQAHPPREPLREVVGSDSDPTGQMEVITLPEGYTIPVRITDEINSKHPRAGEMFSGSVDPSVLVNDVVVIPRGTEAHIRLNDLKKGGHVHGNARVSLELVSLIINGRRLEVESNELTKKKGAASAKAGAVAKKAPASAGTVAGEPAGAALPVIAAFTAAKVQVKPGSRVEFKLEEPFTFRKPPVSTSVNQAPQ